MNLRDIVIQGEIIDHELRLDIDEVAVRARVEDTFVVRLVDHGVLEPQGQSQSEWQFSGIDLHRLRCVARLMRDLDVNMEGAAVILDLLEERRSLRTHLELLEQLAGYK